MRVLPLICAAVMVISVVVSVAGAGESQTETFDSDPQWDGRNNRSAAFEKRVIEQNFGYAADVQIGERPGAIGGLVTPIGVPAYYAKSIPVSGLDAPLRASGVVRVEKGGGNTLFGFFNADTLKEWRTPNTIVFRINGRGDVFHVHIEYATSKWRAGATVIGRHDFEADRVHADEIAGDSAHTWSVAYTPEGAEGRGEIIATFDDQRALLPLSPGHKEDAANFNRFGIVNVVKHADGPGSLWLADIAINGETQDLRKDPHWEHFGNRVRFESSDVRPRFDFGFSPTRHGGGAASGEVGGLFFRGDCRYPERLAYYGARVQPLALDRPIHAAGKFALHRGVSDSTTLFGFFHSKASVTVNDSQKYGTPINFLGIAIEGPSSEGFFVYPVYRVSDDGGSSGYPAGAKLVYPDGASHTWSLDYQPAGGDAEARITLTVDEVTVAIPLALDNLNSGRMFDRFGFVTPWIDGNGQIIYFDDVSFTSGQ